MHKSVFVFTVLLFAIVNSYPATEKQTDLTDVDAEIFGGADGDEPIVDTGYFGGGFYYPSFDGLYKRIQDVITSIRQRIAGDDRAFIETFGDLGKGNTTSYTKIINGHRVEVNETEYKKDTDYGTSHVKVSYINVRPLNTDTAATGTPEIDTEPVNKPTPKDRESLEDSVENEISNVDEGGAFDNIETFDMTNNDNDNNNYKETEFSEEFPIPYKKPTYVEPFGDDLSNDIEFSNVNNEERDLSNDVYVNDLMLADGAPLNEDAELI